MESIEDFFSDIKSISFPLNYSRTKTLDVSVKSVSPDLQFIFKIEAVDHFNHVEFSQETWTQIFSKSSEIKNSLRNYYEQSIFINDELKVFTERMYGECAVSFLDIRGERVNMMIEKFDKMISCHLDIIQYCNQQFVEVKNITEKLKNLYDSIITKYDQCVNKDEYRNHLLSVRTSMKKLCSYPAPPVNVNHANDNDSYNDIYQDRERYYPEWGIDRYCCDEDEEEDEEEEDENEEEDEDEDISDLSY